MRSEQGIKVQCGTSIVTKNKMKVLGILFDCNSSWERQIRNVLKKWKSELGVLKKLRNHFTVDQFLKIITTVYYTTAPRYAYQITHLPDYITWSIRHTTDRYE